MAFRGLNSPVTAPTNVYSCRCSRPKKPTIWELNLLPIYVNGDGLLLALPHCTETWFNAVDQLPHIDIAGATGLLGEGFLPPAQSERLGFLSFLDGVLVMEQTEQAHGINHRCKTATNDSAGKQTLSGHFRPIVHPEVVTHPCCEWLELAG